MTVTDNSVEFIEQLKMEAAARLFVAAFTLQTELKNNLSTAYPPASTTGQFPHGRTWGGRDSVTVMPDTPEEIAQVGYVRIGFLQNAWYMTHLELQKQRLGLFSTYAYMKPQLERILFWGPKP